MNWLNIKTSDLSSPEYIGSEPVSRATWLSVMGYCAVQENSGIIRNCKGWADRQWQQICGITCAEIEASKLLMTWRGNDLVVSFYPLDQQEKYRNKRKAGKTGGSVTSEAKAAAARANGAKNKPSETQADTQAEPKQTPNVKESKEKESKGIQADFAAVVFFPEPLNTPEFESAWTDWTNYRRERGQKLKPTTIKAQLEKLATWGKVNAIASIRQSICNGWQGLFEPKIQAPTPPAYREPKLRIE